MITIDVRTKEEYDTGHADGAINLPLQDLEHGVLPDVSPDTEIMLYCRSGGRSEMARNILASKGFINVVNAGGLSDVIGMQK